MATKQIKMKQTQVQQLQDSQSGTSDTKVFSLNSEIDQVRIGPAHTHPVLTTTVC